MVEKRVHGCWDPQRLPEADDRPGMCLEFGRTPAYQIALHGIGSPWGELGQFRQRTRNHVGGQGDVLGLGYRHDLLHHLDHQGTGFGQVT